MSYLSSFLGTNNQGYSAFVGIANKDANNPSRIYLALYGGNEDGNAAISWNSQANDFGASFWHDTAQTLGFNGFDEVLGYGNALITSGPNTTQMQYIDTKSFNRISFGSRAGNAATFTKNNGGSLQSIYNLGLKSLYGSLTWYCFINESSFTTVTTSRFELNKNYNFDIRFNGNALTAQSIENILVAADNGCGTMVGTGSINLSGGTNSGAGALTTAAAAARTSLIAKGVTISLNP